MLGWQYAVWAAHHFQWKQAIICLGVRQSLLTLLQVTASTVVKVKKGWLTSEPSLVITSNLSRLAVQLVAALLLVRVTFCQHSTTPTLCRCWRYASSTSWLSTSMGSLSCPRHKLSNRCRGTNPFIWQLQVPQHNKALQRWHHLRFAKAGQYLTSQQRVWLAHYQVPWNKEIVPEQHKVRRLHSWMAEIA